MSWARLTKMNSRRVHAGFKLCGRYTFKGGAVLADDVQYNIRKVEVFVGDEAGGQFQEFETHLVLSRRQVPRPSAGDIICGAENTYRIDIIADNSDPEVIVVRVIDDAI